MPVSISLAVQYASDAAHLPTRAQFRRWMRTGLRCDARITLRVVNADEGRLLNRQYRNKDYATNVLTFAYDDPNVFQPGQRATADQEWAEKNGRQTVYGDVVICAPVVEREAAQQHKPPLAHYAHLCIHAALHLQGYEHDDESDAIEMESLESALMLKLGFNDPYEAEQT